MDLIRAMDDDRFFGSAFQAESWTAWKAALRAIFGLPLSESDAEVFRACTGRQEPPAEPCREAWIAAGRRSGKSRIAAAVSVYTAAFRDWQEHLARGERATIMCLAADRRQARVVLRYVRGFLEQPLLARMVERETAESIDLSNGATIEIHTASHKAVRGYTLAAAVCDENASWRSDEVAQPDVETVNALRPALATLPGSLLLGISSPYARRGVLWRQHQRHYGKDGDPVLVWQAPTRAMNPTIPADVVSDALEDDPAAARAEWLAEFREDLETLFDFEALRRCVVPDRRELPPADGITYRAFVDPSGGRGDAFTLGIGHRDGERAVVDAVRAWTPPFNPSGVVEEIAALIRDYRISRVEGDRYAGEWPRERFRAHGIDYDLARKAKSDLYLAMVSHVNAEAMELPDDPALLRELHALERRRGASGRDRVDHPRGDHDDRANAVAGLADVLIGRRRGSAYSDFYHPREGEEAHGAA